MPTPASQIRRRQTRTGNLIPGYHAAAMLRSLGGPHRTTQDSSAFLVPTGGSHCIAYQPETRGNLRCYLTSAEEQDRTVCTRSEAATPSSDAPNVPGLFRSSSAACAPRLGRRRGAVHLLGT
jgi:hypothetical protein